MPNAGDPFILGGALPLSHNPLQRISFTPKKPPVTLDDLIEAVMAWLENILFPAIKQLTGIDLAEFLPELKIIVTNLEQLFGSLNPLSGHFSPAAALQAFVNLLIEVGIKLPISLIRELVGFVANIPIIKQIIQFFTRGLVSIQAGTITTDQPNLYPEPTFGSGSIASGSEWTIDPTSRTSDGSGSAMVVADGRLHALRSGTDPTDTISVGGGQTFTPVVFVNHTGYSGAGDDPILLQVVPFLDDGTQLDPVTLDTYAPTSADVAWPGHQMTGTYTVPAGVTGVQTRYLVTDSAQTGNIRFDDASAKRADKIKKSFIDQLEDDLGVIDGRWQATIDTFVNQIFGTTAIGHGLTEFADAITHLPAEFVQGIRGAATLAESLGTGWDALVSGLLGRPVSGVGPADIANAAAQVTGTAGTDQTYYLLSGQTIDIPSWANYIDSVVLGKGQAGLAGAGFFYGQGGHPGKFNATMWVKGTHYDSSVTSITFTPETVTGNGTPRISITGHTITGSPGSGSQSANGAVRGIGPGVYTFNGQDYHGGGDQAAVGGAGTSPGGGGAGGGPLGLGLIPGGPGGRPAGWIRFRASSVPGQTTGADTTAPSSPTPHFISATNSALVISGTGSVDS